MDYPLDEFDDYDHIFFKFFFCIFLYFIFVIKKIAHQCFRIFSVASNDKFNPTKGSMDYPLDEFDDYDHIDSGYSDSREDYERSTARFSPTPSFNPIPIPF
eukprot:Phypoly_transcript_28593.p3 GENE.Phypoly_transcript_28593~~Phypoly_transcript_28593.p3  ORF type:complete len:116 (+),score=17.04 Phypoly_transcript_28593:46-348(+)